MLNAHGIEAADWIALGPASAPDSEIIAFAAHNGYIVITRDLDFGQTLARNQLTRPSVIQVRSDDVFPEAIGLHVIEAIQANADILGAGALLSVEVWTKLRVKVKPLPIGMRDVEVL